jgi:hypothetical protein
MGRHFAPEPVHRRRRPLPVVPALVGVVAVLAGVLLGAVLARMQPVSGTLTTAQAPEPAPPAAPSSAVSAPPSMEEMTAAPTAAPPAPAPVAFANCTQAAAAGVSLIPWGDPRYAPELDHDGDGIACDQHGDPPTRYVPPPAAPPCTCER